MYAALEDVDLLFVSYLHYLLTWLGNRNLSRDLESELHLYATTVRTRS